MKKVIFFLSIIGLVIPNVFSQQTKNPNIVFILADDLGYGDLGCFGSKIIKTPNLDKLASEGIKLTQFYSGSTVCAPSRAALMSGKHTGHGYIRGNGEIPLRKQDIILPQLLKKAGYQTGMFGKWGLGDIDTGGSPNKKGWDEFYGYLHHVEAHYQAPSIAWQYKKGMKKVQRVSMGFTSYACDKFAEQAVEFIKKQDENTPFFVYLPLTLPHSELYAPKDAMKRYQDENGKSIFPENPYEGSHYGGQSQPKAAYAAMVSKADDYVGEIMKILQEKGIADNTLIIFSSDNGTHTEGGRNMGDAVFMNSSGGLKGVKRDLTEGGIRVPTVVAGAGLPKEQIREGYGAFWDLLPTFLELSHTKSPSGLDGTSQLRYWKTGENWQKKPLYWEFYEGGFFQAVRDGDWKYIKSKLNDGTSKEELYDLKKDVSESNNLAKTNLEQLQTMRHMVQTLRIRAEHPNFRTGEDK
jgi:arylsulfatase A-like enzyme